jgi:cytochrome c551/c552
MTDDHHHAHPDRAAQESALKLAAVALADQASIHRIADQAACPACVAVSATLLGFAVAQSFAGEPFWSEAFGLRLLRAIKVAQDELRAAPN